MTAQSLPDSDVDKANRLRKTKRWAGAVLVTLVLIYLSTFLHPSPPNWILLIRHMAEAGMIGGLADWFAVVALFRHPLGIPIPHTALLPKNKAQAAQSVGRFFKQHFLKPSAIAQRVAEFSLAKRAAEWLRIAENAQIVAKPLTQAIAIASRKKDGVFSLGEGLKTEIQTALAGPEVSESLSEAIGPVVKDAIKGPLMDQALKQISRALDKNRETVLDVVRDKSRWWIPERVDRGVATTLVDGTMSVLKDLKDPKSETRQEFVDSFSDFIQNLFDSGAINRAVHDGKSRFAQSPAFQNILDTTLSKIRESLSENLQNEPEHFQKTVSTALQNFADKLLSDPDALAQFENQLSTTAETAITQLQDPISNYIRDVIDNWKVEELVDRFEKEIGSDLQFIRINGAILGAFIGGCLFYFEKTLLGFIG
ncbi:MAG: DUF445 domain-containing protein [Pseudomonadota bacterium]